MIIATRFRDLPDDQMKHIVDYVEERQADHRPAHGDARVQHSRQQEVRTLWQWLRRRNKEWNGGFGRQVLGENVDQPPRRARQRSDARHHRRRTQKDHPILARHQGRRHLRPDRRLRRAPAAAGRQPAAGPRPGADRHEVRRPAARRQEERPDDAGRVDEDVQSPTAKKAACSRRRWAPRPICRPKALAA